MTILLDTKQSGLYRSQIEDYSEREFGGSQSQFRLVLELNAEDS